MHLVYGLGKSGIAAAKLLQHQKVDFCVFQDSWKMKSSAQIKSELSNLTLFETAFSLPDEVWPSVTAVVVSPGISPANEWVIRAREDGKKVLTEVELGLSALPNIPWIGVTGTNGKSTVVNYTEQIAKIDGFNVLACGNIGLPVCEIALGVLTGRLTPSGLVIELSSYQLHYLESVYTLKGGAITSFAQDHTEWHGSHENYRFAKAKLLKFCIDNNAPLYVSAQASPDFAGGLKTNPLVHVLSEQKSIQNLNEEFAKRLVYTISGMPSLQQTYKLVELPYRWQPLRDYPRVINDSKSTNMQSLVFGVKKLFEQMKKGDAASIFVGGRGKNENYSAAFDELAQLCEQKSLFLQWFCFGESADTLFSAIPKNTNSSKTKVQTLKEAINAAAKNMDKNTYLLFSPGCASFDQFKNYIERGKCFEKLVSQHL